MCCVIADLGLETRRPGFSKRAQNDCAAGRSFRFQSETFQNLKRFWTCSKQDMVPRFLKHHSAELHDDFHLSGGRGAVESFEGVSVQEDV